MPARRGGVHRLLGAAQGGALAPQLAHHVLQVPDRARQPVHPRHHQLVARPHEVEHRAQLAPMGQARPRRRLLADHRAPRPRQRLALPGEVLVGRADSGVAVGGHGLFLWGLDPDPVASHKPENNPYGTENRSTQPFPWGTLRSTPHP